MILDPSLTLVISMTILAIFWLVYQSVGTANNTTVHLVGNRLWGGRDVHIYTKSILQYIRDILKHEQKMPSWEKIHETIRDNYQEVRTQKYSPFLYLPIVNIVLLLRLRKNEELRAHLIQGVLLTILALYGLLGANISVLMLAILG